MKHLLSNFSQKSIFQRIEIICFFVFTVFNLLPLFSETFFPTLDGPAHGYNAQVIGQLLSQQPNVFHDYFTFNHDLVPNWTSHVLLTFLNQFMSVVTAEKVILIAFLIGFPYAFRSLIKTLCPSSSYLSFLIFPFTYTYFFFLGFYNFSIALLLLMLILNYWIKNYHKSNHLKQLIVLGIAIPLMYFSHLFVFAVLVLSMGVFILFKGVQQLYQHQTDRKKTVVFSFQKAGILILSSLFPLYLLVNYFLSRQHVTGQVFLSQQELIEGLTQVRSLITFNTEIESIQTVRIAVIFALLVFITIGLRIVKIVTNSDSNKQSNALSKVFQLKDVWLVMALIMLLMYFRLPDADADAGYVSSRLALLFFIFILIWVTSQHIPKWIGLPLVLVVLFIQYKRIHFFQESVRTLNPFAWEYAHVGKKIKKNALVLPINQTNNWLFTHFSNYLGAYQPLVLLENYECDQTYFPLTWNQKDIPTPLFGNADLHSFPKLEWHKPANQKKANIEYVFFMGNINDSLNPILPEYDAILKQHYKITYSSSRCALFQRKTTRSERKQDK